MSRLTLDAAIDHATEKGRGLDDCAADHRALAEWLIELRDRRFPETMHELLTDRDAWRIRARMAEDAERFCQQDCRNKDANIRDLQAQINSTANLAVAVREYIESDDQDRIEEFDAMVAALGAPAAKEPEHSMWNPPPGWMDRPAFNKEGSLLDPTVTPEQIAEAMNASDEQSAPFRAQMTPEQMMRPVCGPAPSPTPKKRRK